MTRRIEHLSDDVTLHLGEPVAKPVQEAFI